MVLTIPVWVPSHNIYGFDVCEIIYNFAAWRKVYFALTACHSKNLCLTTAERVCLFSVACNWRWDRIHFPELRYIPHYCTRYFEMRVKEKVIIFSRCFSNYHKLLYQGTKWKNTCLMFHPLYYLEYVLSKFQFYSISFPHNQQN